MGRTTQLDYTPVGPYKLHPGSTLFLFSPAHPLRALCAHVATHPHFVNAVLFLIALSSVLLALDNPLLDPSSTLFRFLDRIDYALNLLFTLEMGIKIIAYGLVMQPSAYLRDPWNVLDGCILLVSAVGYLTPSTHGEPVTESHDRTYSLYSQVSFLSGVSVLDDLKAALSTPCERSAPFERSGLCV